MFLLHFYMERVCWLSTGFWVRLVGYPSRNPSGYSLEVDRVQGVQRFALRGSVLDMAVGIAMGAAFGAVVKSFVNDILMPSMGLLLGVRIG